MNNAKKIVIKLGSAVLMNEQGDLAKKRLSDIIYVCSKLLSQGRQVIIVSSGAVGLGKKQLNLSGDIELVEKQACAAVGQGLLMEQYRIIFNNLELNCAQVLLISRDFSDRVSYINIEAVFEKLLKLGVVPIVNENDTVSTKELKEDSTKSFGDNDKLSALVAANLHADLLLILSNVDGVFTKNPKNNPDAHLIKEISSFNELSTIGTDGKSDAGRGGMETKLEAAKIASICGVDTIIASGFDETVLERIFFKKDEDRPGTLIKSLSAAISSRKQWIGLASGYSGVIVVNSCAEKVLTEKQASLLSVGIVAVKGDFRQKEVVSIQNEKGIELGRGLTLMPFNEINDLIGKKDTIVVHRNDLVIFGDLNNE